MKTKLLRLCLTALMLLMTTASYAYKACIEGIYYDFYGSEATVTYKDANENSTAYAGKVTIPSAVVYNGKSYNVIEIGNCAFSNCSNLTSVVISNGVTNIKLSAFRGCM